MEHRFWVKQTFISAVVAASIGLTACGGGGGDSAGTGDNTPTATITTLSGIVADGYLVNAMVCLDLNLSKTCDLGEPSATSTNGGNYSLKATQEQIDSSPVIVEIIAGTTVDEDNPAAPITKGYTLTAPAGKGAFVSPLTTMVQAQIEATGKTAEQIENEILASMGQDPTLVSLFEDYVAHKTDSTNPASTQDSYLQLHQVAQVTATTIVNNIEMIEAAISNGSISIDLNTELDSVITIIVQNVIEELAAIATEIENATSFDANTIATTVDATVDTTTIEEQVAVVEAASNSVTTSNVEALFTTGINWLWSELAYVKELERSSITYDATTGKLSEPIESYFALTTSGWSLLPNINHNLVLQADGTWLAVADSWDGSTVTFDNTTGIATIDSNWGMEAVSNIKASDLTDLNIKQFVTNKLPDLAKYIDPTSVFTAGSKAYSLNITSLEEAYTIDIYDCGLTNTLGNVNGNCNTLVAYNANPQVVINSLAFIISPTAWVNPGDGSSYPVTYDGLGSGLSQNGYQSIYYELVQGATNTSGAVNYYIYNFGNSATTITKIGTGTWAMTAVHGTELLMVDHPDTLMTQYSHIAQDLDSPEENTFFAIQDGVVRKGNHWSANIVENTAESLLTNQQAQDEITNAFLDAPIANTIPSSQLPCDTDTEWNLLSNGPLVTYSFADFEAIVTTCGGALAVDANTLANDGSGFVRIHPLSDGSMIELYLDSTGYYTAGVQPTNPSTPATPTMPESINWTIDPTTNYITLVALDGSFRQTLAAIAVDSTMLLDTFTFKGYLEEAASSDMVTNQGSDGKIAHLISN